MYVPPLGSCELGGFNELITSRFGRHLKNRMLGFPAQILPMMGFSSCDNSDVFQWLKLVSIGGSCSEPFSCLHWSHCGLLLGQGWRSRRKRTENEAIKGKLEGQGEESRVAKGRQRSPKVAKDNQSPSPPPVVYITHAEALMSKDTSNPRETYFYLDSAASNHICHT